MDAVAVRGQCVAHDGPGGAVLGRHDVPNVRALAAFAHHRGRILIAIVREPPVDRVVHALRSVAQGAPRRNVSEAGVTVRVGVRSVDVQQAVVVATSVMHVIRNMWPARVRELEDHGINRALTRKGPAEPDATDPRQPRDEQQRDRDEREEES